jgi:hypothetical protein
MTREKELFFDGLSPSKTMFAQQSVYILGTIDLILAGIAIACVAQAEDNPDHFSLVYIAIIIFIFYMGTILIIIVLQMIETYQQQHEQNQLSLNEYTPLLTVPTSPQLNPIIDESIIMRIKPQIRLPRSHTVPVTFSSFNPDNILSISTPLTTLQELKNINNEITTTTTTSSHLTLLPKYQQTFVNMQKNYHSFACITTD